MSVRLSLAVSSLAVVAAFATGWTGPPAAGYWPTYLADAGRSSFAPQETGITSSRIGHLHLRWQDGVAGPVSDEPVVADQRVFWGSWDGLEHAASVSGRRLWDTELGTSALVCGGTELGVAGTATVATIPLHGLPTQLVFVGGGNRTMYALNAATGATVWSHLLGDSTGGFIWSSPLVYGGSVYVGLASAGDCPLVQGKFFKLNARTGAVQRVLDLVPNGCTGGSVWSSPTLDEATDTIYFTTGNGGSCADPEPLSEAMVEVQAYNLQIVGSWQVPVSARVYDSDFGATPTLFSARLSAQSSLATPLVGAVNKNGIYYAFRRNAVSQGPVWQSRIGRGGSSPQDGTADISPSAFDGDQLYVAGGTAWLAGRRCAGTLRALDPATGAFIWQHCLSAPVLAAVILGLGYVETSSGDKIVVASTIAGRTLLTRTIPRARLWGPASIAGGVLYQGDMNGRIYALAP